MVLRKAQQFRRLRSLLQDLGVLDPASGLPTGRVLRRLRALPADNEARYALHALMNFNRCARGQFRPLTGC
jgi:hypothetical protein